ncbi:MAG: 3-phosphoshikimate 1-carboxyvinyltransferase [Crenarchaeota archaeon]|nr:3-phosphoshikimate 1-carboxyvinyltransferase [Thermoproteota archaeon]
MDIALERSSIRGTIYAPPSKSVAQRLILALSLTSPGRSMISRLPSCEDVEASLRFVRALGINVERHDNNIIAEIPEEVEIREKIVNLGDSGTTYRIAMGIAATFNRDIILECGRTMRRRPIEDLVEALRKLGAEIQYLEEEGYPPIRIRGPIRGGKINIRGDVSSQYISSLIYAGVRSKDGVEIYVKPPIVSRPYIDLTVDILRNLGADVDVEENEELIIYSYPSELHRFNVDVPGDYALSAFLMTIAAVCGEEIIIRGFNDNLNRVDSEIIDHLKNMNVKVRKLGDIVYVAYSDSVEPYDVDLKDTPDLVMPIAALMAFAEGTSVIRNVKHLAYKESNRLREIKRTLSSFGVRVNIDEEKGIIEITGRGKYNPATIELPDDHRIAMMCSVIGLAIDGKTILKNAECVRKSWPEYWDVLKKLGAKVEVIS